MPTAIEDAPKDLSVPHRFRPESSVVALGLAVGYLQSKPAFAGLHFGSWSKILIGQINRKDYFLFASPEKRIVGMLGWAYLQRKVAEAWLVNQPIADTLDQNGDCIVFNVWSGDDAGVHRALLLASRAACVGRETIYYKRFYGNGRVRNVRLSVNDFMAGHLSKM